MSHGPSCLDGVMAAATIKRFYFEERVITMLAANGDSDRVIQGLRAKGVAAALSGAGPSVVCLSASDAIEDEVGLARTLLAAGWEVIVPGWDLHGAQVR